MKETGLIFSSSMVKALLAGTKMRKRGTGSAKSVNVNNL
jgi:hypothetical protein